MRGEFQYFMSIDDHRDFDNHLKSIDGVSLRTGKHFDEILIGDGFIQYQRSFLENNILTSGRISIASTGLDASYNFSSYQEVELLYKKLRAWLKKRSINSLVCYNENSEAPVVETVKNFWLATGAKDALKESTFKLKQFKSGNIVFEQA